MLDALIRGCDDLAIRRSVKPVHELVVSTHPSSYTWVLAFRTCSKTEGATAVTLSREDARRAPAMLAEDPDDDASRAGRFSVDLTRRR